MCCSKDFDLVALFVLRPLLRERVGEPDLPCLLLIMFS